jgi:hypothetical protein
MKTSLLLLLFFLATTSFGQNISKQGDSVKITSKSYSIILHINTGRVDFEFSNGNYLKNVVAFVNDNNNNLVRSSSLKIHRYEMTDVADAIGKGKLIKFIHTDSGNRIRITQYITVYEEKSYFLVGSSAEKEGSTISSNYISPLAILPEEAGSALVRGEEPRLLDMPFDNDDWTKILTVNWKDKITSGTGYEFTSLYDYGTLNGTVIGNVTHDFWKTGIKYSLSDKKGFIDSLIIYGGASTPDTKALPNEYGGYDGTHDVVAHGSMEGEIIFSPLIFISSTNNINTAFRDYGNLNAKISGALSWKGSAPVYWNSFGVEGVLGHRKVMMPAGVAKISEFLYTLKNLNAHVEPTLSIDSYDQGIYSTDVLKTIDVFAKKHHQQMGFYFIPFAIWTWKNGIETSKLQYTDYYIRDVSLKDNDGKTIIYKDGEFGAFPLDPTHPGTRLRIIAELQKAKAINARFLKIDFLTAGALETPRHYNPSIKSGLQAYNFGMKMLKHLIDSILGPDIFITQAISPTFPAQFAHARFLSTDIYSHFRDDSPGFPHYGGTASSMITNAHLGWMQGSILPYTNLDVLIMKNFQNNAELSERDIRVRLFSLITLGSILGDGSDYRDPLAASRAKKYLDNKYVGDYFAAPRAFIPIKFADGLTQDQQLCFYQPGKIIYLSSFNFDLNKDYVQHLSREQLSLKKHTSYIIKEFLTDDIVGRITADQDRIEWITKKADARLVRITEDSK